MSDYRGGRGGGGGESLLAIVASSLPRLPGQTAGNDKPAHTARMIPTAMLGEKLVQQDTRL